jgi:O-antigen ligase
VACAAIPVLVVGLYASTVRSGLIAVGVGAAVVIVLLLMTPGARGRKGMAVAAVLAVVAIGVGAYEITVVGNPKQEERFSNLLSPGDDEAWSDRLTRWAVAWDDIQQHPWGHGLGTSGGGAAHNPHGPVVTKQLDSSYLKIGLEQGLPIMLLYAFGLVSLLIALARRASLMRDPQSATLAIGACGTLATMVVLFFASLYNEGTYISGAWLIVGLGVAQVTVRSYDPRNASATRERAPAPAPRTPRSFVPPARTPRPVVSATGRGSDAPRPSAVR